MISFFYETEMQQLDEKHVSSWIKKVILTENKKEGELVFIFCSDEYLLKLNQEFLNHDTFTDIISFDNSLENELHGDIFISKDRVEENASKFNVSVDEELRRVMVHGVLHFCGYKDKSNTEKKIMRQKEDDSLLLFHVEQQ